MRGGFGVWQSHVFSDLVYVVSIVEIVDELIISTFGLSYHRGFKRPVVVCVV